MEVVGGVVEEDDVVEDMVLNFGFGIESEDLEYDDAETLCLQRFW